MIQQIKWHSFFTLKLCLLYSLFAYFQLQQNALAAQEQVKVANEKISELSTTEKSKRVLSFSLCCLLSPFVIHCIIGISVRFQIFLHAFWYHWLIYMTGYKNNTLCNFQEVEHDFISSVMLEARGINVELDQSRCSVDRALSFVDELNQNLSLMAQGVLVWFLSFWVISILEMGTACVIMSFC